jgi:hypothetical protein
MGSAFGWVMAIFAAVWLFLAARGIAREIRGHDSTPLIVALMGLLVIVGAGGFFAAGLSAVGMLKLSNSFEWPAGYVSGVAKTADGKYVVPLIPSGRVQIYSSQWHFVRGWHVNAEGGDFRVEYLPTGEIEVLTARGQHRYTFNDKGDLISAEAVPDSYYSLPKSGQSMVVPTPLLLWPLSSPFLSWGLAVVGFAGLAIVKKLSARRRNAGGPHCLPHNYVVEADALDKNR